MSTVWPKTPRELLEARYKAFAEGDINFIFESHHPDSRAQLNRGEIEEWAKNSKWLGFIIGDEKVDGDRAVIDFTVRYEKNFETINHREFAQFRKDDGRWFYFDSEFPKPTSLKREGEKIGRNDPCLCGSGKKFKKCCGN